MNSFLASVLLVSSVSCLPGGGYYRHGYGGGYGRVQPKAATQNIAELVSTNPKFSTLLAAVKAAGLVDTLASEGPFTVFAPTNAAFAKVCLLLTGIVPLFNYYFSRSPLKPSKVSWLTRKP